MHTHTLSKIKKGEEKWVGNANHTGPEVDTRDPATEAETGRWPCVQDNPRLQTKAKRSPNTQNTTYFIPHSGYLSIKTWKVGFLLISRIKDEQSNSRSQFYIPGVPHNPIYNDVSYIVGCGVKLVKIDRQTRD